MKNKISNELKEHRRWISTFMQPIIRGKPLTYKEKRDINYGKKSNVQSDTKRKIQREEDRSKRSSKSDV